MTTRTTHLREDQLYRAAFTIHRRDVRRKRAIRRLLVKRSRLASVLYFFDQGLSRQGIWEQG